MKAALPWILVLAAVLVRAVGSYYFHDGLEVIAVSVISWCFMGLALVMAGPRLVELMKQRRRQVDESWEQHPGNPKNKRVD